VLVFSGRCGRRIAAAISLSKLIYNLAHSEQIVRMKLRSQRAA